MLPEYLTKVGVPFHIETQDTYSVVKEHIPEGKTMQPVQPPAPGHSVPAWPMSWAPPRSRWATTVMICCRTFLEHVLRRQAEGHAAQGAKSDRGDHLIIRPWPMWPRATPRAGLRSALSIIPCTLCGSRENLQRKQIGQMLRDWQQLYPGRIENMAVALRNPCPSHFMDTRQFDFKGLVPNGVPDADGDKAFDAEVSCAGRGHRLAAWPLMPLNLTRRFLDWATP